jgi:hypothetical protein
MYLLYTHAIRQYADDELVVWCCCVLCCDVLHVFCCSQDAMCKQTGHLQGVAQDAMSITGIPPWANILQLAATLCDSPSSVTRGPIMVR